MQTSIFNDVKVSYAGVLLAALVLYVMTCAPGVLWQDSGVYQYRIWHNDIEGRGGLALSHPLYHLIGIVVKYIPIGEFAYKVNLISAVAGAFAVANLFLLVRLWLKKSLPALLAAVTLAVSHTFWRHAVIAEDYTLYAALLLAELIMLLQYVKTKRVFYLYLLGLFNGLAISTHMFASIGFICYLVFLVVLLVQRQIRLKDLGIIVGLWIVGAAPYEYLVIKKYIQTGDFAATMSSAFFGERWRSDVVNMALSAKLIKENLILIAYNFPTPNVIFFFAGVCGLKKVSAGRAFKNILLGLLILFFVFAFRYTVPDRYAFFIPFYCLACILFGVGFDLLINLPNRKNPAYLVFILALLPIPTYIIAPAAAEKMEFNLPTRGDIPYRNDYQWFLRPWKTGYRGGEQFADEVFSKLESGAVVYADDTMVYPLVYAQQVKGKRGDIRIISQNVSSEGLPVLSEKPLEVWLSEGDVYAVSPVEGSKGEGIVWKIIE
jgi:hypothetical protein